MLATVIQTPVDVVHKCLHKLAAVDDLVQRILLEKRELMTIPDCNLKAKGTGTHPSFDEDLCWPYSPFSLASKR